MTTTTTTATRFHLSLHVRDLGAAVAFYRDLLGVEPSKLHPGFARFTPDDPPLVLSLAESGPGFEPQGAQRLSHLGFRLGSAADLEAARRRLVALGRQPRDQRGARCCYAVQDKFWVRDPDGNEWEFYRVLEDLDTFGEDAGRCCD